MGSELWDRQETVMDRVNTATTILLLLWTFVTLATVSSLPQPAEEAGVLDSNNDAIGYLLAKRRGYDSLSGYTFGKRNFDELDRARFSAFAKRTKQKRNFDEIDRARFGSFHKRNFDELDRARFGSFHKRNFDEIDKVGFGAFNRYFK